MGYFASFLLVFVFFFFLYLIFCDVIVMIVVFDFFLFTVGWSTCTCRLVYLFLHYSLKKIGPQKFSYYILLFFSISFFVKQFDAPLVSGRKI